MQKALAAGLVPHASLNRQLPVALVVVEHSVQRASSTVPVLRLLTVLPPLLLNLAHASHQDLDGKFGTSP